MGIFREVENQKQYLLNNNKSLEALKNYHCPIYSPDAKGNPISIGSSVLIDIFNHKFLVTAGHVLDYTYTRKVSIKSGNKLVNITGEIIDTKFAEKRSEDKIDLALLELNEEMKEALLGYDYLKVEEIEYNHISNDSETSYTFIGFPATKNKLIYNTLRVKASIYSYTATRANKSAYYDLGITPITHIAIKYRRKKLLTLNDNASNAPDFSSMSGGGIWLNDNLHHHPTIYKPKIKLVGIALSKHKKNQCLMGVSTGAVIELIKANCNIPELMFYRTNMIIL